VFVVNTGGSIGDVKIYRTDLGPLAAGATSGPAILGDPGEPGVNNCCLGINIGDPFTVTVNGKATIFHDVVGDCDDPCRVTNPAVLLGTAASGAPEPAAWTLLLLGVGGLGLALRSPRKKLTSA